MANNFGEPNNARIGNDFSAEVDNKGKWSGSETYTAPFNNVQPLIPNIGSPCPRAGWEFLTVESFRIDNVHGNLCTISVKYAGPADPDFSYDGATAEDFTYELGITSSEEPIETHPKYQKPEDVPTAEKEIIGNVKLGMLKRETPTGYTFKDIHDGKIYTISSVLGKELVDFILAGVQSYFRARQTWRERYQTNSLPEASQLNAVGKITNQPKGSPPLAADRDWLFVGMNTSQEGNVYTIVSEYELSGAGGWEPKLYS